MTLPVALEAWGDFLHYRARLIDVLLEAGHTPAEVVDTANLHDEAHVERIAARDLALCPPPVHVAEAERNAYRVMLVRAYVAGLSSATDLRTPAEVAEALRTILSKEPPR